MTASDDFKPGKVFNLYEMVNYNPGSVVSRTLVKSKAGTITCFAFSKGQELSPHSAPFDAMVQGVDGEATITIDTTRHKIKAGEIMVMPAHITHALTADENFKMLLIMIKEPKEGT